MIRILTPIALLLAAPLQAATFDGFVEGFLWKGPPDTGGVGVRGHVGTAPFFGTALVQAGERLNTDVEEVRLGGGFAREVAPGIQPFALVEALRFEVEGLPNETGIGLHGGLVWQAARTLAVTAQVGLVEAGDLDGSELLVGGAWEVMPSFSLLVERRESALSPVGAETRFGGRFSFGFSAHRRPRGR